MKTLKIHQPKSEQSHTFFTFQWFPSALFIIYRLVITSCCVKFAMESVCNNPSYFFFQFDGWSVSAVCLYFILGTLLLIYCTIKTWRENKNKEKVETSTSPGLKGRENK